MILGLPGKFTLQSGMSFIPNVLLQLFWTSGAAGSFIKARPSNWSLTITNKLQSRHTACFNRSHSRQFVATSVYQATLPRHLAFQLFHEHMNKHTNKREGDSLSLASFIRCGGKRAQSKGKFVCAPNVTRTCH